MFIKDRDSLQVTQTSLGFFLGSKIQKSHATTVLGNRSSQWSVASAQGSRDLRSHCQPEVEIVLPVMNKQTPRISVCQCPSIHP